MLRALLFNPRTSSSRRSRFAGFHRMFRTRFRPRHAKRCMPRRKKGAWPRRARRRIPRIQAAFLAAQHRAPDGWCGIPSPAFRNALISACRTVGFQMTRAKLGFFVLQDGFDVDDATPLTRITKGEPEYFELPVRIAGTTTDPACLGCPRRCDAVRASDGGDGAVRWKR